MDWYLSFTETWQLILSAAAQSFLPKRFLFSWQSGCILIGFCCWVIQKASTTWRDILSRASRQTALNRLQPRLGHHVAPMLLAVWRQRFGSWLILWIN